MSRTGDQVLSLPENGNVYAKPELIDISVSFLRHGVVEVGILWFFGFYPNL